MFNLVRLEKILMLLLAGALLLGVGILSYQKSRREPKLQIETFRVNETAPHSAAYEGGIKININEAGIEDLMRLNGIGRSLAERIVEYRATKGRFYSIGEIKDIKGIGEALFKRIEDDISVE